MDFEGSSLRIRFTEAVSSSPLGSSVPQTNFHSGADTSFPILVIAIIGIVATIFLLTEEPRGLDEAIIRSIPIFQYKSRGKQSRDFDQRSYCECAVCLNEFQEDEKLRIIPSCSHVFHIDCIDIWLQNNANCPLCRTSVSARPTAASAYDLVEARIVTPSPSPQDPAPGQPVIHSDEDYVVIELGSLSSQPTELQSGSGEPSSNPTNINAPSPKKLDTRVPKKGRKLPKGSSMGDEFINTRGLGLCYDDKHFEPIQPIRRSISMDSAADRHLLLAVREILQQKREEKEQQSLNSMSFSPIDQRSCSSGSSSRFRKTFFSFGHGRASRSAVQPVCLGP
ncbi:RING-H2 finger protein ATL1 isoform X2 [Punica granatum]|uniref:RING-type E3 ubiquitin transferase n=1 Tax=Punica granatum TaxID=22663 RepID=A0A6P8DGS2_PUNGR|nr:RING-H2 finger protein ATL1 isoform X2 [Punica granatum]